AAESMRLARAAGLDAATVAEALGGMGPASPVTKGLLSRILHYDTELHFALALMDKDVRYASRLASDAGLNLSLLNATRKIFDTAVSQGLGDEDWSMLYQVYENKDTREGYIRQKKTKR
ncbi:hypothetical protein COY95_01100, partial [Candidatus Woesearchaeota archaeon CG_4_10_14_0_8_um_filter_47_5]